jgi:hypothetical protein
MAVVSCRAMRATPAIIHAYVSVNSSQRNAKNDAAVARRGTLTAAGLVSVRIAEAPGLRVVGSRVVGTKCCRVFDGMPKIHVRHSTAGSSTHRFNIPLGPSSS